MCEDDVVDDGDGGSDSDEEDAEDSALPPVTVTLSPMSVIPFAFAFDSEDVFVVTIDWQLSSMNGVKAKDEVMMESMIDWNIGHVTVLSIGCI